ncbi:SDR family NAD(P)-dependent oxidoreductase, partial [bacterium AH-315-F03]|nr:SDR family NAD(P)-dependent oxidoreductase [bacterium AH-315-F03]
MAEFPKHTDIGRVLITGANGFVGAALCREFLAQGWNVVAGVRRGANLSALAGLNLEYQYGDVTHPESLTELLAGIDTIVHNAGMVKAKRVSHLYAVN